eukprot:5845686-Alexandrium_andersonii.AAC.1
MHTPFQPLTSPESTTLLCWSRGAVCRCPCVQEPLCEATLWHWGGGAAASTDANGTRGWGAGHHCHGSEQPHARRTLES